MLESITCRRMSALVDATGVRNGGDGTSPAEVAFKLGDICRIGERSNGFVDFANAGRFAFNTLKRKTSSSKSYLEDRRTKYVPNGVTGRAVMSKQQTRERR